MLATLILFFCVKANAAYDIDFVYNPKTKGQTVKIYNNDKICLYELTEKEYSLLLEDSHARKNITERIFNYCRRS